MKILVIEDDVGLAEILVQVLNQHHYIVEVASDGELGWTLVDNLDFDLVLLDLILPKLDGIQFCERLRASGKDVPVLLMTAEHDLTTQVMGLDAGADDYVVKPLDMEELLARIRALLRRGPLAVAPVLTWGPLKLDPGQSTVTCAGKPLRLTAKEYELLALFLRTPKRVFSTAAMIDQLWSFEKIPTDNAVRVHIKSLRYKLKQMGLDNVIETVYGLGYRLQSFQPFDSLANERPMVDGLAVQGSNVKLSSPPLIVSSNIATQTTTQTSIPPAFKEIWERNKHQYWEQLDRLNTFVLCLKTNSLDPQQHQQALRDVHTLKGALGSFGFMQGSQIAAEIEQILSLAHTDTLSPNQPIEHWIAQLNQILKPSSGDGHLSQVESVQPSLHVPCGHESRVSRLLIVERDLTLLESLIAEASAWGIQTQTVTTLTEARKSVLKYNPDCLLLDLNCADSVEESFAFLSELSAQNSTMPLIVSSARETLVNRVAVAKAGGTVFLRKPFSPTYVLESITQAMQQVSNPEARLMIVDDDPAILQTLTVLLAPWGFSLTLLSDPIQFWETLERIAPDLLLLDIEMPAFSGLELCQAVRNAPQWQELPILFLSGHTDGRTIQKVFEMGADDYISKPLVGPELLARVLNRLERVRVLRSLADTDSLTGLSNRRKSVQDLDRLLQLAYRQGVPLCLAILDLDHFKQVNDQQGHEIGDRVLRKVGHFLRQTLRGEDVVARWGGEEFVIGLYGLPKTSALDRLNDLLEQFRQYTFQGKGGQAFQVTFSGGIAEFPEHGHDVTVLYQSADQALYQAKARGRNQMCLVEK